MDPQRWHDLPRWLRGRPKLAWRIEVRQRPVTPVRSRIIPRIVTGQSLGIPYEGAPDQKPGATVVEYFQGHGTIVYAWSVDRRPGRMGNVVPQFMPFVDMSDYEALRESFEINWITEGPKSKKFNEDISSIYNKFYGIVFLVKYCSLKFIIFFY